MTTMNIRRLSLILLVIVVFGFGSGITGAVESSTVAAGAPFDTTLTNNRVVAAFTPSVRLLEAGDLETLVLEQFAVFSPDARIVLHFADGDETMQPPANTYFKGHVEGRPGSMAYIAKLEGGRLRGLVASEGAYWVIGGDAPAKSWYWRIESRRIVADVELGFDTAAFECATDGLPAVAGQSPRGENEEKLGLPTTKAVSYTARIGVETDNEFFNKFGNATDATNYVADIIAYGSMIYGAEVNTSWLLQHLSLWPQGQTDPWAQSNPGCGLYEFGRYWNDNHQAVSRTTAVFLSGKSSNSGIAWVGVLCQGEFTVNLGDSCSGLQSIDNYGGGYAYVGGIDGNFDIDNPGVVWDIVATTHEIGHNFSSPHTHCYENVGGNANAIDECYSNACGSSGCHCGAAALPSSCPGGGQGCGTIMSYCHLLSPGMSNLSLTLGLDHPYGVEPERVPAKMLSHVVSRASSYPGCLDYESVESVFDDGFESNNTNAWDDTVQ